MNEQIKAGADIHAGEGEYSLGNQADYDAFIKARNESLSSYKTDTSGKWVSVEEVERVISFYKDRLEYRDRKLEQAVRFYEDRLEHTDAQFVQAMERQYRMMGMIGK